MICRSDLPPGTAAAQIVHATGESIVARPPPPGTQVWVVVLAVRDEGHLLEIAQDLVRGGIPHVLIREPDLGGSATAIGVELVTDRRPVRKVLSSLPLYGKEEEPPGIQFDSLAEAFESKPRKRLPKHIRKRGLVEGCANKESLIQGKAFN